MVEERFIDLANKRRVVLTDKDLRIVRDNPAGLTLEGAKASLYDWLNRSKNRYLQGLYAAIVQKCKNFKESGKLSDGRTILSRDEEDKVTWAEWLDIDLLLAARDESGIWN